ncbi:MAG: endonuclease [Marmoricola sp.]|nr:endonuclease [Marmoricola sp.]
MTSSTAVLTADPVAELHACLDRVALVDADELDAAGQADLLLSMTRAEARIAAVKLTVLAAAERTRTALRSGAASTGQWAAKVINTDQAAAHRQVGLAQGLDRRIATQRALSAGDISPEHAAVIIQADRQLPSQIKAEQRDVVERTLISKAQALSPGALRKAARRALAAVEDDTMVVDAHENEIVADLEARARARTRLTMYDNADGTVTGHFTIPVLQGHLLRKVLETITAPRRSRLGATHAQAGDQEARTDWDRARGDAFCELLEHVPTDHLHPKTAATLVVSLELDTLRDALKVAHLDTDESLSADSVRRLACTSSLLPAVLDGASLPLDLGRSARLFSEAQRTALGIRHKTCAADGCERPFAWCELHHLVAWALGGKTDLDQAVPLCHFHHQRIHDGNYQHVRARDGSISFHQRR